MMYQVKINLEKTPMRRLNTRQLSKRFHKEIDDLPILLMKNQKPFAVILPYDPAHLILSGGTPNDYTGISRSTYTEPVASYHDPMGWDSGQPPLFKFPKIKLPSLTRIRQILNTKIF